MSAKPITRDYGCKGSEKIAYAQVFEGYFDILAKMM